MQNVIFLRRLNSRRQYDLCQRMLRARVQLAQTLKAGAIVQAKGIECGIALRSGHGRGALLAQGNKIVHCLGDRLRIINGNHRPLAVDHAIAVFGITIDFETDRAAFLRHQGNMQVKPVRIHDHRTKPGDVQ
ncbi:hypothetical protein DYGSA30_32690 [Dyella sp. GSA-30]|nr:hypothetical protein DYGSA30_32690 [Dyella sp. GSA-30]